MLRNDLAEANAETAQAKAEAAQAKAEAAQAKAEAAKAQDETAKAQAEAVKAQAKTDAPNDRLDAAGLAEKLMARPLSLGDVAPRFYGVLQSYLEEEACDVSAKGLPEAQIGLLNVLTTTRKILDGKYCLPSFDRTTKTFLRQAPAVKELMEKLLKTKTPFQPASGVTCPRLPGMANALKHLFYAILATMGIVVKGPKLVFYNSSVIHLDNVEQAIQIVHTWATDNANLTENLKAAKAAPLFNVKPPSKNKFPCQHPGRQKGGNTEAQLVQHMKKCRYDPKNGGTKRHTKGRDRSQGRGGGRGHQGRGGGRGRGRGRNGGRSRGRGR